MSGIDPGFAPDDVGVANGNYFGLPFRAEESELVLLSAPWDATVSYNAGTAEGPESMIEASTQVELRDIHYPEGWKRGIGTVPVDEWFAEAAPKTRKAAKKVIEHLEKGGNASDKEIKKYVDDVNDRCSIMVDRIYTESEAWLAKQKIIGLVGGDHSTPLGLIQALGSKMGLDEPGKGFGILHVDAHADLRESYEGFTYSHASIMYNALRVPQVEKLVQVGIRDFSEGEAQLAAESQGRVVQFDDYALARNAFDGLDWGMQCEAIIGELPDKVYISFDIDGLSPDNCPGTGTPVPGGLSFHQAVYLLVKLVDSGRRIIGFDLTEVAPKDGDGEWNANLGARILYKLCNLTLKSNPRE